MEYSNTTGYPSVSDILSPFVDKTWFKDIHRDRGHKIHSAISSNLKNLFVPSIPVAWQPYYDSWIPFRKHIVEIISIEERLVSKEYEFCGQPDLVARLDSSYNNCIALLDWKTSQVVYKTFPVQLGGYLILLKEKGIIPDIAICARLRKEPGKKILLTHYDRNDIVYYMNSFIAARRCYKDLIQ